MRSPRPPLSPQNDQALIVSAPLYETGLLGVADRLVEGETRKTDIATDALGSPPGMRGLGTEAVELGDERRRSLWPTRPPDGGGRAGGVAPASGWRLGRKEATFPSTFTLAVWLRTPTSAFSLSHAFTWRRPPPSGSTSEIERSTVPLAAGMALPIMHRRMHIAARAAFPPVESI